MVNDRHPNLVIAVLRIDFYDASCSWELDRIGNQVEEHLLQLSLITEQVRQFCPVLVSLHRFIRQGLVTSATFRLHLYCDLLIVGLFGEHRDDEIENFVGVEYTFAGLPFFSQAMFFFFMNKASQVSHICDDELRLDLERPHAPTARHSFSKLLGKLIAAHNHLLNAVF